MNRAERMRLAQQTVDIVAQGAYISATGNHVDIAASISHCLAHTRLFEPEALARLRDTTLATTPRFDTVFEVVNETSLMGAARIAAQTQAPVALLNFASAKNPGGGFLNGSQAQEESLALSSALYASLLRAPSFYQRHRAQASALYSDAMILSPHCPVFRNDQGELLATPLSISFITSAAPNAGAIANQAPHDLPQIANVLRQRAEYVLTLAASAGYTHVILGAWGCGVFRNDPHQVAQIFAEHLHQGAWAGRFERVVFSVLDKSATADTFTAFKTAMG